MHVLPKGGGGGRWSKSIRESGNIKGITLIHPREKERRNLHYILMSISAFGPDLTGKKIKAFHVCCFRCFVLIVFHGVSWYFDK